jgi:NADH dehydrogenase
MKTEKIVIVGGGYAGLYASKYLSKSSFKNKIELTVITKENFHIWHGFIGEMLTGRILPTQILSPARRIFKNAKIHIGIAKKIDFDKKRILAVREIDGNLVEIPYDKLIYAAGSKQSIESFEGLYEHGFAIKTWDDCYNLKNHILRMFELASITEDEEERKAMLTFFIAGGGFSGSEIAGEIADFARLLCNREFNNLNLEEVNVFLAHPSDTILPELFGSRVDTRQTKQFPKLVKYAHNHLEKNGVTIKTSTKIKAVSKNMVLLSDGTRVPTKTVISAVGTIAQPLTVDSGFPLSKNGKIITDRTLKVPALKDVWACGDCAFIEHPNGGHVPSTAWWGMMAGQHIAKNIIRLSRNKKALPKQSPLEGGQLLEKFGGSPLKGP